ncbi:hypothetical protein PGTUg99_013137 [Puccinia graminis f. sp. tritici]|uniref:Uncharacterized protein n=1 Tax=Puccinia graminis f. sp. tritici TaxID=56615 RepID=A0A5B0RMA6_PUCGR|nr:hypothetical protein PGTUg99_013137 [Puccinia graminis f. sp. tritici]
MGPMETTTQALNLERTSIQGLKPEGHHPRFEPWPMALKIPSSPSTRVQSCARISLSKLRTEVFLHRPPLHESIGQ